MAVDMNQFPGHRLMEASHLATNINRQCTSIEVPDLNLNSLLSSSMLCILIENNFHWVLVLSCIFSNSIL